MVDRITPVTATADREWLLDALGVEDRWPVVAEPFRQWVMEDDFSAGRPPWEDVGALFTDRIHDWELYKLRLLNAGHSCMAYLSALAGMTFVHEAMAIGAVRTFLEELLHREAMPTLAEIPGHPREQYIASVLERFANAGVRDQIARVCIDGSVKFTSFLIPTIARELEVDGPIERCATAMAGWARYLAVVDPAAQAPDSDGDAARQHAAEAVADPVAFLEFEAVFPPAREVVRALPRRVLDRLRPDRRGGADRGDGTLVGAGARRRRSPMVTRGDGGRLQHDRQRSIYMLALREGSVDVADLARRYGVTTETIRRDLSNMQSRQLLRRVHGGAIPVERMNHEPMIEARDMVNAEEKLRIAALAVAEVPERGSVIIDSGSTGQRLAELFPVDRDVHVVTNSLLTALTLSRRGLRDLTVLGGSVRTNRHAMVDDTTRRELEHMAIDVLFMSCDGLSFQHGLTTPYREEQTIKRAMITCARRVVAMVDQSKFGNHQMFSFARFDEIDVLVTDTRVDPEAVDFLSSHDIAVERA